MMGLIMLINLFVLFLLNHNYDNFSIINMNSYNIYVYISSAYAFPSFFLSNSCFSVLIFSPI